MGRDVFDCYLYVFLSIDERVSENLSAYGRDSHIISNEDHISILSRQIHCQLAK